MKSTRTRALTVRGTNPGTHTVTLRAVRTLLARIWNQAAPEQGLAYDFTDLTDAKINWRRNLFKESEFRNGINDTDLRAGVTWVAAGVTGFVGSIAFGAGADAYAYKQIPFVAGRTYTMSVFVKMDDGTAPALGTVDSSNAGSDFSLVIRGNAISPAACTSTHVGNNVYRVSYALANTGTQAAGNCGIVKYASNSAKTFKVSGYQIEIGLLSNYQPITDGGAGDFLREFPTHSLYQDHVGNLPVTNVEQPVGLVLDMRQQGFRGAEMVPDPGFNTPGAWTTSGPGTPAWTVANGVAACTAAASGNRWIAATNASLTVGKWYEVFVDLTVSAGGCLPDISSNYAVFATTSGRKHWILQATIPTLQFFAQPSFVGSIDNLSFREVPGNHALQPTTGDRPTINGRFNWLTNSEVMSDTTYWVKSNNGTGTVPVITDNFAAGPDGSMTATRIQMALNGGTTTSDISRLLQPITTVGAATYYLQHFWAKTNDGSTKQVSFRDDFSGTVNTIITVTPTWQQFYGPVNTFANNTTVNAIGIWLRGGIGTSDSVDMLVWHPQVERSTVVFGKPGPYQRVGATATDYDPIGFTKGAKFNGTNSWLFAPGVDLTGSDKLLGTACIRRESDATTAVVMEHGPDSSANAGTFALFAPGSNATASLALRAMGASTTIGFSGANATGVTGYNVVSAVIDIANAVLVLRRDGANLASNATPLGAGNFTNRTFYIGRRGGTGLPYNGMIYRIGVRGGLADNFIGLTERWATDPAKAFL